MDIIPLKRCHKCLQEFPATPEFFCHDKNKRDGFSPRCKQCRDIDRKPRYIPPEGKRRCSVCRHELPATLDYFSRNANRPSGLQNHCKFCDHIRWQRYSQSQHEHLVAKRRSAKLKNPQVYKEAQDRYCQTEHGKANRAAIAQRRRARETSASGSFTAQDVHTQYARQKGQCYWCSVKLGKSKRTYHVDHIIPLSRGGSNDVNNLVIACPHCNVSRNDRLPHEWPEGGRLL